MANNYLVTLASEQLYRAAQNLISALDSTHYLEPKAEAAEAKLQEALSQYRNLAYQSDLVIETKPLRVPTGEEKTV